MDITKLSINQKKRLFQQLYDDEQQRLKLNNYKTKYPEFKNKINHLNLTINELTKNIDGNKKIIEKIKLDFENSSLDQNNYLLGAIKSYEEHNGQLEASIIILKNYLSDTKKDFEKICLHKWIQKTDYKFYDENDQNHENNNMKGYIDVNEEDIQGIKNIIDNVINWNCHLRNKIDKNIDLKQWKKKLIPKSFHCDDCYDRETYYVCKNCDYKHTVSFYSK